MKKEDLRPVKYTKSNVVALAQAAYNGEDPRDIPSELIIKGWFHGYEKEQYYDGDLIKDCTNALIELEDGTIHKVDADQIVFTDRKPSEA